MDYNDTYCHSHNPLNAILLALCSYSTVLRHSILAGWVSVESRTVVRRNQSMYSVYLSVKVDESDVYLPVFSFPLAELNPMVCIIQSFEIKVTIWPQTSWRAPIKGHFGRFNRYMSNQLC